MKFRIHGYTPFLYKEKELEGRHGAAKYCLMTIDPRYKDDLGLFHHELRHIQHWWVITLISLLLFALFLPWLSFFSIFVHGIAMTFKPIRLMAEVDCFAIQASYSNHDIEYTLSYFAKMLASDRYNLDITEEKAYDLLRKRYHG